VLLPGFKGRYTVGEGWGEQHNADSGKIREVRDPAGQSSRAG
jgi:hypothetical protein